MGIWAGWFLRFLLVPGPSARKKGETYTLAKKPRQIKVNGEIPIGIQTRAPVMTDLEGCSIPTISKIAPMRRRSENVIRRTHPELLEKP